MSHEKNYCGLCSHHFGERCLKDGCGYIRLPDMPACSDFDDYEEAVKRGEERAKHMMARAEKIYSYTWSKRKKCLKVVGKMIYVVASGEYWLASRDWNEASQALSPNAAVNALLRMEKKAKKGGKK